MFLDIDSKKDLISSIANYEMNIWKLCSKAIAKRLTVLWRAGWDSNPRRLSPRRFSRPVHSTTLSPTHSLEAALGFEPRNQGFAGPCLTTWLYRQNRSGTQSRTWTGTAIFCRGILSPLCLPIPPSGQIKWILIRSGADNESRTRDPNLGKVVLYHWAISAKIEVKIISKIHLRIA